MAKIIKPPLGIVVWNAPVFDVDPIPGEVLYLKDHTSLYKKDQIGGLHMSCYDGMYMWPFNSIEIIGNIYENPELLK